jgi:hypothetical protein
MSGQAAVNVRNLCVDSMLAGILRERALSALRHSLAEVDRLRAGAGKKQSFLCRSRGADHSESHRLLPCNGEPTS